MALRNRSLSTVHVSTAKDASSGAAGLTGDSSQVAGAWEPWPAARSRRLCRSPPRLPARALAGRCADIGPAPCSSEWYCFTGQPNI